MTTLMDLNMADTGETEDDAVTVSPPPPATEKTLYDTLRESKKLAEDIVAKMLSIKTENKPKSQLPELATLMFLNFVSLRQANRSILVEEDRVKAETDSLKAPVDSTTLQLHNLMYEKKHYVKAIKTCKDFKSKYPDINLVPVEEFFKSAPDEIRGAVLAQDSAHGLMLNRLNYELFQRKDLCQLRERLEQQKKSLLETIANRKKFLSSLPSHLKSLKKASLPVQNQLGVAHTKKLKQQNSAKLLPPPLYIIYSQLVAQKEAFSENIDLEIAGSVKDALAFACQQANKDTEISVVEEGSKADDDIPDEEDDDQRRRKRPRKVPAIENLDQAVIYQPHPLRVILNIYDDESLDPRPTKLVTLKFEYLVKLNVVCVGVEGSNERPEMSILCNLFPDDTGIELPHQSGKLFLGDGSSFDEKKTQRPYKWAQHLAGIDFLPDVSPLLMTSECQNGGFGKSSVISGLSLYRKQNRAQTIIHRVRERKKAQMVLADQLDLLANLKWPSLACDIVPWASHTPLCSIHSWLPVGLAESSATLLPVGGIKHVQENNVSTNMIAKSGASAEEMEVAREDGELPLLMPALVGTDLMTGTIEGSDHNHSKQLYQISKSLVTSKKTLKSLSFTRLKEDADLLFDSGTDDDDLMVIEKETEDTCDDYLNVKGNEWVDYGMREFCLVLVRNLDIENRVLKLEAKVYISIEYPLRPPVFILNLLTRSSGESASEAVCSEWYNELRSIEAEINLQILKTLPIDQEYYILSHQIRCLVMLFDSYLNEASQPSERKRSTCVLDIGLAQSASVSGALVTRSLRGRDRRKMISWKEKGSSSGYPY